MLHMLFVSFFFGVMAYIKCTIIAFCFNVETFLCTSLLAGFAVVEPFVLLNTAYQGSTLSLSTHAYKVTAVCPVLENSYRALP